MSIIKNKMNTDPSGNPIPQKKESVWDIIKFVIFALIIVIPIRMFVAQPFLVKGRSMDPTFHEKDYLIVDEFSYHFREPKRGEVIIFRFPGNPKEHFIKRVIGIPGDTINIENGKVTVKSKDGVVNVIDEGYIKNHSYETIHDVEVPDGNIYVMGDNRSESYDSRMWGLMPIDLATGRAFLRLYPFNKIGYMPGEHLFTISK